MAPVAEPFALDRSGAVVKPPPQATSIFSASSEPAVPHIIAYVLLLCAFLYSALRNQSWGLPESWPSDEIVWIVDRMLASQSMNPNYFMYPSLTIYAAYFPSRIVLWLLGDVDDMTRMYVLGTICRTVSALAFLVTCIAIERICAKTFGLRVAIFALAAVGLNGALVHHAHIGTVNSVFFMTIALALYCLVWAMRTGRIGHLYLAAAACGFAVGAKYNALFLCPGVSLVHLLKYRQWRPMPFVGHMLLAGVFSLGAFILTTPYILLDSPAFWRDMSLLLEQEGPSFKTPASFPNYLLKVWTDCLGFFSPYALYTLAAIYLAGCAVCLGGIRAASRTTSNVRPAAVTDVFRTEVLLLALLGLFLLFNYFIGIFQSRYSIPGAVVFLCMSLIGWYALVARLRRWPRMSLVLRIFVVCPLLFVLGVNAYVHVEAFSHSAKGVAATEIRKLLSADPTARIGVVAYPGRSPFELRAAEGRVDVFTAMVADYNVSSWDDYLEIIGGYFRDRSPKYVAFEDIMLSWTVFLPKRYASDYSKRLAYPNPGPKAWNEMLASSGYIPKRTFNGEPFPDWVYALIGTWHRITIEGVGTNQVLLYER